MEEIFQSFIDRYETESDVVEKKFASPEEISILEAEFEIMLPEEYKDFVLTHGSVWTPDILEIVIERNLDVEEVTQFWTIEEIIYDKKHEWTSNLEADLIPFATDGAGNIFAFKADELKSEYQTAAIYFYDHDFETIEKVADSFLDWIEAFNKL